MSQVSRGILGVIAISLAFGAVAWGRDLAGTRKAAGNRAAKADRATAVGAGSAVQTRTISLRLDSLSDTSILIRMPASKEASNGPSAPSMIKRSSDRKTAVACEPPVSVLTEVAKLLQPGRCVT
jgi:hypothetical protein